MDGVGTGKLVGNVGFMAQYILYLRISRVLPESTFCAGIIMPNACERLTDSFAHSSQSTVEVYEKNGSIGKYEPFFPLIRYLFASAHLLRGGGGSN